MTVPDLDLAFEQASHGVTLRRARRFELALGTIAAMLDPSHPAQDVVRVALDDPEDAAKWQRCEACVGTGKIEDDGYLRDCSMCDGTGKVPRATDVQSEGEKR